MANFQVYPTNLANPGRIGTIRMTLNIIFVLIIITHARGFESIKIFGGEGDLAAPYLSSWLLWYSSFHRNISGDTQNFSILSN